MRLTAYGFLLSARVMLAAVLLAGSQFSQAREVIRIAVAANFKATLEEIAADYQRSHAVRFVISSASSGILYAQIRAGAPFDLFFSADSARPLQLEQERLIVPGTRTTYAYGRLVLWTPGRPIARPLEHILADRQIRTLAIANPKTSPYGAAAEQTLRRLKFIPHSKIVRGENISQTFQFLATGSAEAGFISRAQIREYERATNRSLAAETVAVDPMLHQSIEQQAVVLRRAQSRPAARAFFDFIGSEAAQKIIAAAGYRSPTWAPAGCHACGPPAEGFDR